MAKTVDEAKAVDIAGEEPVTPVPTRILTEDDARIWLKLGGFKVPEDCDTVYVTEDKNVFWKKYADSAFSHSERNNLKIFTLNEWTK